MRENLAKICAVAYRLGHSVGVGYLVMIGIDDNEHFSNLCWAIVKDFDKNEYYGYIDEFLDENLSQNYIDTLLTNL